MNAETLIKVVATSIAMTAVACTEVKREDDSVLLGDKFILPDHDAQERFRTAEQGDAQAAYDVYMHLAFGGAGRSGFATDPDYWLERSAELGDPRAIQDLEDRNR